MGLDDIGGLGANTQTDIVIGFQISRNSKGTKMRKIQSRTHTLGFLRGMMVLL
ncbi:MAG: hypothetical protein ACI909_002355, partial [Planctomycetota bacterium]